MTTPTSSDAPPPRLSALAFHGPLSEERAARIVARLAAVEPASVLDVGCGWGELLLRVLAAAPGAEGVGVDLDAEDLERGRRLARERGLAARVRYVEESARGTGRGPADVVLCNGAGQALAEPGRPERYLPELFAALRSLVNPGGRVLLGEGFYRRPPTGAELSRMWPGATAEEHPSLGVLVDAAVAAGFRPLWTETASDSEWEEFESGYRAAREEWLAAHPGHALAPEVARAVDTQRSAWLHGYREVLGIAYLTLVPVV
ncbi:class I SAM-dependent methyltransferase [Streptomyces sp. NPDC049954]|uniref:SAM-dependent methyltransferase n=1 Tax=Streptomyces sp. NPDC049954 TaxID=3155779 RepID=UPI0034327A06